MRCWWDDRASYGPWRDRVKPAFVFFPAALLLLTACVVSLWAGKTVGLYGIIETRTSIFYWIIVVTYGGLGILSLIFAFRTLSQ
jgi:hypothetical protein